MKKYNLQNTRMLHYFYWITDCKSGCNWKAISFLRSQKAWTVCVTWN